MRRLGIALAFVCLPFMILAEVRQTPGSQYLFNGLGPRVSALGFSGITLLDDLDAAGANPATPGNLRRVTSGFSLTGLGGDSLLSSLSLALPTGIGVLSAQALYGHSSSSFTLQETAGLSLRLSKPITEDLFWGFGLSFLYADLPSGVDRGFWGDLGVIWRLPKPGEGIGLFNPSFGLVLRGLGVRLANEAQDRFPPLGLGLGARVDLIELGFWRLGVQADFILALDPLNPVFGLGVESKLFDFFTLRWGYLASDTRNGISGLGPISFGLGLGGRLRLSEKATPTEFELSWSVFKQHFHGQAELAHSLGLSIAWGSYDSTPPSFRVRPNWTSFSPNFDGHQDEVDFSLEISDNELVWGWRLEILDSQGSTNRVFQSVDRFELRSLTLGKFFEAIFSSKEQVEIPETISWNAEDRLGEIVEDGVYHWRAFAWDENKNTSSRDGRIRVDTRVPKLSVEQTNLIFSPNNDGVKDRYYFTTRVRENDPEDILRIAVLDSEWRVVRFWEYQDSHPEEHSWDGKDQKGLEVPEGVYRLKTEISDQAGNRTEEEPSPFRLVRTYESVELQPMNDLLSTNPESLIRHLKLKPRASSNLGLQVWRLVIRDSNNRIVDQIDQLGSLPEDLVWNGFKSSGEAFPDGFYTAELALRFDSGNHPVSPKVFFELDSSPPEVRLKPEYLEFSPNGDGKRDSLALEFETSGQGSDRIRLRVIDESGLALVSRDWELDSLPETWIWDGRDDQGRLAHEGFYTIRVEFSDRAGNKSINESERIRLKTGLEKVSLVADRSSYSPGRGGRVVFTPSLSSSEDIIRFEVKIFDDEGNLARRLINLDPQKKIEWDGRDQAGDPLPDGSYSYQLSVKYSYGDEPESTPRSLKIDTRAPELAIKLDERVFSPNGDSRKDSLLIEQRVRGDEDDRYYGEVLDQTGRVVFEKKWLGSVPELYLWDGSDGQGQPLPEGDYIWRLRGLDQAGNPSLVSSELITLVRRFDTVELVASPLAFSPNGDGDRDKISFFFKPSRWEGVKTLDLTLTDLAYRKVLRRTWTNEIPTSHTWDGLDPSGRAWLDGWYQADLVAEWESGNQAQARLEKLVLDAEPPRIDLVISPRIFTPDGDGENDLLYLNPLLSDFSGIADWSIQIRRPGSQKNFKTFHGLGSPSEVIVWDGRSEDGQDLVEAVQDYELEITARDPLGNQARRLEMITVGVLVERLPEGLKIRVSSVRFATDSSDLTREGKEALDKVIAIIQKILSQPLKYGLGPETKIEISGHTDDLGDPGYNLGLSERRARAVYHYFLARDLDPRILTWKGYGLTRPFKKLTPDLHPTEQNEARERNRRVEFFIKK